MNASAEFPTILLVEDDDGVRFLVRRRLRSAGCNVIAVARGQDALAQDTPVDLMITDHVLPDMMGTELIDTFANERRLPPFIVTTGHGDERLVVEMLKRGARDYIAKDMAFPGSLLESVDRHWQQLKIERRLLTAENAAADLERELMQSRRLEAVGRLAGGVAHDFNNILFVIMAEIEMAQMTCELEPELASSLQTVLDAADRGRKLTRQLLALSRQQVLQIRPVDLHITVRQMLKLLSRLIGDHIELKVSLEATRSVVLADRSQLEQVLLNLCVNARDAMPDGGVLHVSTLDCNARPDRHCVRLIVEDSGSGISPEIRERMFEPFVTTKDRSQGGGLGLATVHGIVKQHDGTIHVQSTLGKGTRFVIALPTEAVDSVEEPVQAPVPSVLPGGSETILIVEDEPRIRRVLTAALERLGYVVLSAGTGDEAITLCNGYAEPIDLLLSDVVMPGVSGYQAALVIRQTRADIQVLFMSGFVEEDIVALKDVQAAGFDLVEKPIELARLAVRVRMLLDAALGGPSVSGVSTNGPDLSSQA